MSFISKKKVNTDAASHPVVIRANISLLWVLFWLCHPWCKRAKYTNLSVSFPRFIICFFWGPCPICWRENVNGGTDLLVSQCPPCWCCQHSARQSRSLPCPFWNHNSHLMKPASFQPHMTFVSSANEPSVCKIRKDLRNLRVNVYSLTVEKERTGNKV